MSSLLKLNPNFKPAFDGLALAKELFHKVKANLAVEEAYLFGSSAEMKNTPDSDLDILLIVPDGQDLKQAYSLIHKSYTPTIAVDWIVMHKEDFNLKKEIGGVSRIAFLTGIRIC